MSPCSYTHVSLPRLRTPAHPPSSARVLSTPRRYHGLDGYGTTDAGGDGPARDAYAESLNDDPGDDTCCTVRETVQSLAIHNMRLLLANRTFEAKAGLDGDGWRRGGFDVNAWNVSGTHMRVCGDCSAALTNKECPSLSICRLQQNFVPLPYVDERGAELYAKCGDPECACYIVEDAGDLWPKDGQFVEQHIRLLPPLCEDALAALAPARNRTRVIRLVPSGKKAPGAMAAGVPPPPVGAGGAPQASGRRPALVADHTPGSRKKRLQRGRSSHCIHFPHDFHGLEKELELGCTMTGQTSFVEALATRKVVLVSPSETEVDLLKSVKYGFPLDVGVARAYARLYRLYHPRVSDESNDDILGSAPADATAALGEVVVIGSDREFLAKRQLAIMQGTVALAVSSDGRSSTNTRSGIIQVAASTTSSDDLLHAAARHLQGAAGNVGGRTDEEREAEHGNGDGGDSHSDDPGSDLQVDRRDTSDDNSDDSGRGREGGRWDASGDASDAGSDDFSRGREGGGGGTSGEDSHGDASGSDRDGGRRDMRGKGSHADVDDSDSGQAGDLNDARREPEERGPIAVVHGKKPLGDFSHQSQLVAAVYPQHFPQARGMMFDPYRRHNYTFTPTQWKRLTFGLSNRARSEDAFLLDLNNMETRRRMLLHAQLRFKRRDGDTRLMAKELSSDRLKMIVELLASGRTRDDIYKTHPQYARLMQNVSAVSGLVPGTVHARKRSKAQMVGLATERSALNLWFTLNLDEFGDGNIVLVAGFPDGRLKECKTVAVKREFLETLVARDPAALATWFREINVAMIKHLFGFDVSAKPSTVRGTPGRRGLFGTTLDYFAPLECAQRGGLHAHYVIWTVEGALLRRFCMDDDLMPLVAGINARFIDSVVSAQAQACIEHVTPEGAPVVALLGAEAVKLDSYIDRHAVLNRDPGTGVPYALEPTALPPKVATVAELLERRAERLAPVQTVCVILRQLQRDNLRVLVGAGGVVMVEVPPIGRIQHTLMAFLDDGGVAAAAMKAMWTTAVHSLGTVERGVAALNVRVAVGVTVRNILRCFQRRCVQPPGEETIPSLCRIQRTILGFLHSPQEAYDARVVCETGGIVVQRLLHGLRHLVAQSPEYNGQHFRTCRKVTASSHPSHSFRFYAPPSLLYGVLSHVLGSPRSCSLDSPPCSPPYRPFVFQNQEGCGAGAVSLRLWVDRAQVVLVHPLFYGPGAPAAERFRARRAAQ